MSPHEDEEPKKKDETGKSEDGGAKSGAGKASTDADELSAASDRIRETAKWLVATFGAVAGALIVGLQLSDIGNLEGSDRVIAAIAAFSALAAVILIVALASIVLARGRVPLSELSSSRRGRKYKRLLAALNRNRSLYSNYGSVPKLVDKVEEEWDKQVKSWDEMTSSADPQVRAKAKGEFDETKKVMPELNMLARRVMAYARAEDVRLTFERVRNWIIALAIVVAIGGGVFAYVDSVPDEEEDPAVSQRPAAARLHLDTSGREKMETILGPDCKLGRVPVEVLSSSEEGWDAVSIPAEGCHAARLTIEPEDGELQAIETVALNAPSGGGSDDGGLEPPPG
jgi:hypothetical protein